MWMGTKLSLLQKSGRRLGWQPPETITTENTTSARNPDAPSKVPSDFELPKTQKTHRSPTKRYKLTDIQVRQNPTSNGKWKWKSLMLSTI